VMEVTVAGLVAKEVQASQHASTMSG